MRRADRLFQIVQIIRGRRLTTAAHLAQRLEVSERMVYRAVADLQAQGVPIDGEAGVGYRLGKGFDLPPLMFTTEEAQALVAAVRIAQSWLDPALAAASANALGRVLSVLPSAARAAAESLLVIVPPAGLKPGTQRVLQQLREAAQAKLLAHITYRDATDKPSERSVFTNPKLVNVDSFQTSGTFYDYKNADLAPTSPARGMGDAQTLFNYNLPGSTRSVWNAGAF